MEQARQARMSNRPDVAEALAVQRRMLDRLVEAMSQHGHVRLIETHISWIVLAPPCAYKFKKPLVLPFLDYSTLSARRFHCEEELRLNRRLAPELYLGLAQVTGTCDSPAIAEAVSGPVLDYAVKMRALAQEALWKYRGIPFCCWPWARPCMTRGLTSGMHPSRVFVTVWRAG